MFLLMSYPLSSPFSTSTPLRIYVCQVQVAPIDPAEAADAEAELQQPMALPARLVAPPTRSVEKLRRRRWTWKKPNPNRGHTFFFRTNHIQPLLCTVQYVPQTLLV